MKSNGAAKKEEKVAVAGRSKSADSKWKERMNRGIGNMSKSLPSFNKVR
ncbi:Protein CBG25089 [Caenorhabditis briggsae]|uniref:Protein CBG25089 n=1 Tax=Caenorhabditis briggsae TaxID=6238 RepID=B0K055_CAEBR|nr:Protein CBG25089 [Caenorhabditis briggsae]CAP21534.1 Protein CBG25089 [Caenorhabditis briggsae]